MTDESAPSGSEVRGFALYVGVDESKAAEAGIDLSSLVDQLKQLAARLSPESETHAAVALAPKGVGGRDLDVVRLALHDPDALSRQRLAGASAPKPKAGIIVDVSRRRVVVDGETAPVTAKEYELLQFLVLREGRTVDRDEIIGALWVEGDEDAPNARTIDVHVRRLRSKLGAYEDIVRTVRGVGYRFDRHPDVSIRYSSTRSPDMF